MWKKSGKFKELFHSSDFGLWIDRSILLPLLARYWAGDLIYTQYGWWSLKMEIKFLSARAHILSSFAIRRFSSRPLVFFFSLHQCKTKKGFDEIFAIHISHIARLQWLISVDRLMCISANYWYRNDSDIVHAPTRLRAQIHIEKKNEQR